MNTNQTTQNKKSTWGKVPSFKNVQAEYGTWTLYTPEEGHPARVQKSQDARAIWVRFLHAEQTMWTLFYSEAGHLTTLIHSGPVQTSAETVDEAGNVVPAVIQEREIYRIRWTMNGSLPPTLTVTTATVIWSTAPSPFSQVDEAIHARFPRVSQQMINFFRTTHNLAGLPLYAVATRPGSTEPFLARPDAVVTRQKLRMLEFDRETRKVTVHGHGQPIQVEEGRELSRPPTVKKALAVLTGDSGLSGWLDTFYAQIAVRE